jgi:hypothetical protein
MWLQEDMFSEETTPKPILKNWNPWLGVQKKSSSGVDNPRQSQS